jgi:tRNA A-37 threonylcarbamoyl transferase component Bud32
MSPNNRERWLLIKEIFDQAIELDPHRQSELLDKACADNPSLRAELESLLASHETSGGFMEKPVFEEAPHLFEDASVSAIVGQQLGQYRVISELGKGGMGIVYLAEDTRLGRQVAMKAVAPKLTSQEHLSERFRREARAAAALSHPGIATVYSLEEFDGVLYIISEYIRGETTRAELSRGPLHAKRLLETAAELASAVAAAHKEGIIHRDLKPENVIRSSEGRIKVLDFGLASIQDDRRLSETKAPMLTRAGTFLGTAAYASPEQLRGRPASFSSDVFSLGVMMYEMASGIHPFGGSDSISTAARILEREPEDLSSVCELSPSDLGGIITKCLKKEPADRYPVAGELADDLDALRVKERAMRTRSETAMPRATVPEAQKPAGATPLWWWQFHQIVVGLGYYLMLFPIWKARAWTGETWGTPLFFLSILAVGIAANLRLHLCFTSKFYPSQLTRQRKRMAQWIRIADLAFVMLLLAAAAAIFRSHAFWAALHLGVAIGSLVSILAIEPAAEHAAFEGD